MRLFPALLVVTVFAAAAACDEPAGSERGVYVLRTVGDSTVPFVQFSSVGYRQIDVADTIVLDGHGAARETSVTRVESTGQPPTTNFDAIPRRYAMRGDTVAFILSCPSNAPCARPSGVYEIVTGGMAMVALDSTFPIPTRFFERIR